MQYLNTRKAIGLILALALFTGGMQTALAAGTSAGTSIDNTATVDYRVGGFVQPTETSNTESVTVDNRVDLTVDNVSGTNVLPSSTEQPLTFTVTNDGNATQGYSLVATNGGGDFNMSNISIYIDNGNGTWDGVGTETAYTLGDNAFDLAEDATSVNVYVVADTPLAVTNTQTAVIDLLAITLDATTTTVTTETAGANNTGAVPDVVFGDGAGTVDAVEDGQHSAAGTYTVAVDVLTLAKSHTVEEDPFNGTTDPKAIPGGRVRYTLLVTNPGATDATLVQVVDAMPPNTTYVVGSITLGGVGKTDGSDADEADFNVTNADAVTVNVGTLAAGASATITFDVTID